ASGGAAGHGAGRGDASGGSYGTSASPRVDMYVGNKRYVLYDKEMLWIEAAFTAVDAGGYLATITSEEENALIYEIVKYGALNDYYIGALKSGEWTWSVTEEPFEFADWAEGEPNNGNGSGEKYVGIYKDKLKWNDYPDVAHGYIVEYDLKSSDEIITDNIISGIVIGHNTSNGKLKKSNDSAWNDNPLKITEVAKTEYYSTNKAFSSVFNSETVKVVTEGIDGTLKYTGSFSNSGIAAITVTCGDYQRLIPINIIKTIPTYIEITTYPKTEYEIWDEFDISGIILTADYNDGSTKEITATNSDLKFTVPDMNSLGTKEINITFLNTEASYVINVEKRTVIGTVQIIGTPEVNNTLSAKILSISDANAKESVTYQWFVDGVEQSTADTLLVKETMAGKTAVLKVSGAGNYRGSFESSIEIRKKDQSAPVTPPQIVSITDTKVILETTAGMQYTYCIGDVSSPNSECVWQPSGEFEGLLPNTTYSFFSRMAESQTANSSASSGANVVKTLKTTISGSVTVSGTANVGETLSADTSSVNAGTNIAYQWYRNGLPITSAVYDSYTLTEADEGAEIYVIVSGTNSFTGVLQSNFVTVETDDIAPTAPTIVVDSKNAVIGENVKINVNLKNNPGITSARVTVTYDPSILKLEDVLYNTSIGGQAVDPENIDSINGSLILYWADGFNNMSEDCAFATLTFRVSDTAATGSSTTVSVSYDSEDIYDVTETNVTFAVVSGDITIINYVPGDINDDGAVNSKDTTRLMRYLAGWDVEVNEAALDINGDGVVNSKDTTRLMRYLAGWDVEIY
ncbi:MAG: hypothetical protein E7678_06915, partial [Ruminococcaceae bacterium]|nr:hypothetical protein [Oscillospiraceae bacterium]